MLRRRSAKETGVIKKSEYAQVPDVVALLGLTVVNANAVVALEQ